MEDGVGAGESGLQRIEIASVASHHLDVEPGEAGKVASRADEHPRGTHASFGEGAEQGVANQAGGPGHDDHGFLPLRVSDGSVIKRPSYLGGVRAHRSKRTQATSRRSERDT